MGTGMGGVVRGAVVALALSAVGFGAGCATDDAARADDAMPPIMEPGVGGAGQAGMPAEQIPPTELPPPDPAPPPEPSSAPAPSAPPGEPPSPPAPGPGPGPGAAGSGMDGRGPLPSAGGSASASDASQGGAEAPQAKPDVAPRPAGGDEFDPMHERPSGADAAPSNIRTLE